MTKTLGELMENLDAKGRADVEMRAAQLIEDALALQSIRRDMNLTQETLAAMLGMDQGDIAQAFMHSDFLLAALQRHIQAAGGKLSLVVEMPGRTPVVLTGFSDLASSD